MQQVARKPDLSTLSLAGAAGLVLGAMLILGFALDMVLMTTTGGPPLIQLASLKADIARFHGNAVWPVDTWIYTLLVVPFSVFVLGVRSSLSSAGQSSLANMGALAAILFNVVHTFHNLAILGVIQILSTGYVAGTPEATSIEAVTRGLLGFAYAAFEPGIGVGTPLFVISMIAFGRAQRRSSAGSWSWRLALVSAGLMAVGSLQVVFFPALFVALLGWIAGIAWTIVTGAGLLRNSEQRMPVLAPQPA